MEDAYKQQAAPVTRKLIERAESRVEKAEARTVRAEIRTEEAKNRAESAEIRAEHAETRTESAKTRTEHAEARTEQAVIRTELAETRAEQAEAALETMIQKEADVPLVVTLPVASGDDRQVLEQLTARQREVLQHLAAGHNTKEIASLLEISPKTVEYHRLKLMAGLNVHDIPGLVRFALRVGMVSPGA